MNYSIRIRTKAMPRGNPNPKHKLTPVYDEPVADSPVSVKLPISLDEYVRSLPNRTEWLRAAIATQAAKDLQQQSA